MRHRDIWTFIVETLEEYQTALRVQRQHSALRASSAQNAPNEPPVGFPEDYIHDAMAEHPLLSSSASDDERAFIRESFLGVLRYEPLCDSLLQAYCDAMKRNRQDRYTMFLMAYLLVYRFNECGGSLLRSLFDRATSPIRICEFLTFLLDHERMITFAKPILTKSYADAYVESFVLGGTLYTQRSAIARDVLAYFEQKALNPLAAGGESTTSGGGAHPEENLLQGFADTTASSSAAPQKPSLHKTTASSSSAASRPTKQQAPQFTTVVRQRDEELKKIPPREVREMLHTIAPDKPPAIEVPPDGVIPLDGLRPSAKAPLTQPKGFKETARPMNLPRLVEEQRQREAAVYEPDPVMRGPRMGPAEVREVYATENIRQAKPIKATTTTIRREALLYRRRDEQEANAIAKKAQELRDDSEYQQWRATEEARVNAEREAKIAQRKLELMLGDEEARAARAKQEADNLQQAQEFRSAMSAWRDTAAAEASAERQRKVEFAEALRIQVAEATEAAQQGVRVQKRHIAEKVRTEKEENEVRVAVSLELERQRKAAMIAEIRAVHAQSVAMRAETIEKCREARRDADLGLLDGMSMDELYRKLAEVKQEHATLEATRRSKIIDHRTKQREELARLAERCETERYQFLDRKDREREERRAAAAAVADKVRAAEEAKLIELQAKLQEKRDSRKAVMDKRREEERLRNVAAMLVAGDAGAVESKKWAEMERGVTNRIMRDQSHTVRELKSERAKQTMMLGQREVNITAQVQTTRRRQQASDDTFHAKRETFVSDREREDQVRSEALAAMRQEKAAMRTRTA